MSITDTTSTLAWPTNRPMELLKDSRSDISGDVRPLTRLIFEVLKSQDHESRGSEEEEVGQAWIVLGCLFSNSHGVSSAVAMGNFGKVMLVVKRFQGQKKISAMKVTLKLQA